MPNIIITNSCNLQCPYCFANKLIKENNNFINITKEQLIKILNWLTVSSNIHQIGIIGGEPTLHPNFLQILNIFSQFCIQNHNTLALFTNGIYLDKILYNYPNQLYTLININTPAIMTELQYNSLINNLNTIQALQLFNSNITLGCNICQEINDYSFFWNILDQYLPINIIRISIVAPTHKEQLQNKHIYYSSLKNKFLNFIKEAEKRSIKIRLDCNYIPNCFFNDKEKIFIQKNILNKQNKIFCTPIIDITPDFKATSCFGIYNPIDCSQFSNYDALYNYLLYKKNVPLILKNNQGKCVTCEKHELLTCQGGCLAFANNF